MGELMGGAYIISATLNKSSLIKVKVFPRTHHQAGCKSDKSFAAVQKLCKRNNTEQILGILRGWSYHLNSDRNKLRRIAKNTEKEAL